jgi:hypothetical protein
MRNLRLTGLAMLALGLAACAGMDDNRDHSKNRPTAVSESDMAAYCRGEASAEFGVRPQDITTLPVEKSGTAFTVYGEYAEGTQTRTFQCKFDGQGQFQSVAAN